MQGEVFWVLFCSSLPPDIRGSLAILSPPWRRLWRRGGNEDYWVRFDTFASFAFNAQAIVRRSATQSMLAYA
jgi:hypothetical protein